MGLYGRILSSVVSTDLTAFVCIQDRGEDSTMQDDQTKSVGSALFLVVMRAVSWFLAPLLQLAPVNKKKLMIKRIYNKVKTKLYMLYHLVLAYFVTTR